jgi:uncharacterized protein YdgA (DUF945 family)
METKIMKKISGLVIVLAALLLGGYYGMGVLTEKTIKKNVEIINKSNGLTAAILEYKRGWFCSNAQLKWKLHVPERAVKDANGQSQNLAAQDYEFSTPIKIHHGPIIYANHQMHFGIGFAQTDVQLPKQYIEQFDKTFSGDSSKPQLDLSIFVNYLNNSELGISLPHFILIDKEGKGKLDWMGMQSTTSVSSKMDKVKGSFDIDGVSINKDETKVDLGKVTSVYDLHRTASGLFLGEAKLSLPSFVVTVKDKKVFEIKDFAFITDSNIDDGLFEATLKTTLHLLVANDQTYGPAEVEVSLRNLDADILAKINEQASAMQNGNDSERQQAMMAMLPELPKLFAKGAEFEISKFNVTMPQGVVDGHLLVSLPKGPIANPFELAQKIHGTAQFKLPTELVKLVLKQRAAALQAAETKSANTNANQDPSAVADAQLQAMQQSGLFQVDGANCVIEISLDEGKFMVNKKQFEPAMLKF